jgi:hypothetical protein
MQENWGQNPMKHILSLETSEVSQFPLLLQEHRTLGGWLGRG